MNKILILVTLAVCVLSGCSRLSIEQVESAPLNDVKKTTSLRAWTFFDAKSELAKARTTMTEKTQGVSVSGLTQESSGSNAVQVLRIVVEAAAAGATKGIVP